MAPSLKQQLAADLDQTKQLGKTRLRRIKSILAIAVADAFTEAKSGGAEVRATGQRSLRQVLQAVLAAPPDKMSQADAGFGFKALVARATAVAQAQAERWPERYGQLQQRAATWDQQLAGRYGDDYAALKQRYAKAVAWYQTQQAAGQTLEPQGMAKQQADWAEVFSQAGGKIAQKEDAIKQQVRQALKAITVTAES